MSKKCLLISGVPSPFQVELAEEISLHDDVWSMDVWFFNKLPVHRGEHWISSINCNYSYFLHESLGGENISLLELIEKNIYDLVVCGLPIHLKTLKVLQPVLRKQIPVVMWNEQPVPRNAIFSLIKMSLYRFVFNRVQPIGFFAIGDRAVCHYRRLFDGPVYLVPYFQKLSNDLLPLVSSRKSEKVRFLFSGRLIARNNIKQVLKAISILVNKGHGEKFEVRFFGAGDLHSIVFENSMALPRNIRLIEFEPKEWSDRMQPIIDSDVLLSPGNHSGWGLTIPEALSVGVPVISSLRIESARFYIKDGLNGLLCDGSTSEIVDAMLFFINNPENVLDMGLHCKQSSVYGNIEMGRVIFSRLLSGLLNSKNNQVSFH